MDRIDFGAWYALVPLITDEILRDVASVTGNAAIRRLKGVPSYLDVTLVGPSFVDVSHGNPGNGKEKLASIREFGCSLGTFLSTHPDERFDLAVLFQPGFELHGRQWKEDGGIPTLVSERADRIFITS